MHRSSWSRERGSALIEAVVIGSFVFVIIVAAVAAAIDVSLEGGRASEGARVAAIHAARHAGPEAAATMAGGSGATVTAQRVGDAIEVVIGSSVGVPHPDGIVSLGLIGRATMPLAPFRSDRG